MYNLKIFFSHQHWLQRYCCEIAIDFWIEVGFCAASSTKNYSLSKSTWKYGRDASNRTAAKNDVSLGRKKRSIDGHHFSFHVLLPILNSDRTPRSELDDDGRLHRSSFCPCASCRCCSSVSWLVFYVKIQLLPQSSWNGLVTSVKIPFSYPSSE